MLFFDLVIMGWLVWGSNSVGGGFGASSDIIGELVRVAGELVRETGDGASSRRSWFRGAYDGLPSGGVWVMISQ